MLIYEKPDYIQVSYRPQQNYILFDWTDFFITLEDIKVLHQKALDLAQDKHCFYYVAETSKVANMLRPEVIKWWGEEWVDTMAHAGIQGIITIPPKKVIATLSTHSWQSQVVNGIVMQDVKNLAEAEALIRNLYKKSIE